MAEQHAFDVAVIPTGRGGMYPLRVWLWEHRRRRMARQMHKRGAAAYEVILALRADAKVNPPPRG